MFLAGPRIWLLVILAAAIVGVRVERASHRLHDRLEPRELLVCTFGSVSHRSQLLLGLYEGARFAAAGRRQHLRVPALRAATTAGRAADDRRQPARRRVSLSAAVPAAAGRDPARRAGVRGDARDVVHAAVAVARRGARDAVAMDRRRAWRVGRGVWDGSCSLAGRADDAAGGQLSGDGLLARHDRVRADLHRTRADGRGAARLRHGRQDRAWRAGPLPADRPPLARGHLHRCVLPAALRDHGRGVRVEADRRFHLV